THLYLPSPPSLFGFLSYVIVCNSVLIDGKRIIPSMNSVQTFIILFGPFQYSFHVARKLRPSVSYLVDMLEMLREQTITRQENLAKESFPSSSVYAPRKKKTALV